MNQIQLQELRSKVESFEELITAALHEKYEALFPPEVVEPMLQVTIYHWTLLTFFDRYVELRVYPIERLGQLMHYLFDIKLQMYYILDVDMGGYNRLNAQGYDSGDPGKTPHLWLSRLSLEQSLIGKTRILWERLMNFIYFLEMGDRLENKLGRRSKKTFFFNFANGQPRWKWLLDYQPLLDKFDDQLRTPEFHKMSTLRGRLERKQGGDSHEILTLNNVAMNVMETNILAIIAGGKAHVSYHESHGL